MIGKSIARDGNVRFIHRNTHGTFQRFRCCGRQIVHRGDVLSVLATEHIEPKLAHVRRIIRRLFWTEEITSDFGLCGRVGDVARVIEQSRVDRNQLCGAVLGEAGQHVVVRVVVDECDRVHRGAIVEQHHSPKALVLS